MQLQLHFKVSRYLSFPFDICQYNCMHNFAYSGVIQYQTCITPEYACYYTDTTRHIIVWRQCRSSFSRYSVGRQAMPHFWLMSADNVCRGARPTAWPTP